MLRHCYRSDQGFRLREILFQADPVYADDGVRVLFARYQPLVELSKLVYFAISVFWRACARSWAVDSTPVRPLEFGAVYKERLRLFLLGNEFPADVALRTEIIAEHEPSLNTICFPYGGRVNNYHQYSFIIPGIMFDLLVGQRIPDEARRHCTARSPEGSVLYSGQTLHRLMVGPLSNRAISKKLSDSAARRQDRGPSEPES